MYTLGVAKTWFTVDIFLCVNLPDENVEVEAGSRMRTTIVGVFQKQLFFLNELKRKDFATS